MPLDDIVRETNGGRGGPDYRYASTDQRRSSSTESQRATDAEQSRTPARTRGQRQRDKRGNADRPSVPAAEARHTGQPQDLYERLQDRTKLERDDINFASAIIGLATRFL